MNMILRFVVVPAIPTETGSMRSGARFYCETAPIGFNIYDNEEKLRLMSAYQTRAEAEGACLELNQEQLQSMLSGRESMSSLSLSHQESSVISRLEACGHVRARL
ncbi:hypothetical protein [Pseudomonas bubulae]|uniref:hypothetical protein n=1 Tax=Pseudomonas bubulae TaxID=2316085 RepID=UPI00309769D2